MSDLEFVPKNQYRFSDVSEGIVPAGSIPIGGGDDFVQAENKRSLEAFMPGVERRVSWGDSDIEKKPVSVVKRGPGRPRKIQVESDSE